jgi:hypothetical protein
MADYDRRNFSISPCKWVADAPQEIIPIYPPSHQTTSQLSPPTSSPNALSVGAITGIAIAASIVVIILAVSAYYFLFLKPR